MFKIFFYLALVLLFSGCVNDVKPPLKPNQKAFEKEDRYILFALRAEEIHDHDLASKLFDKLYEKSAKKEYLYRSLQNSIASKRYEKVIKTIDKITNGKIDDFTLIRLKIITLSQMQQFQEAKTLALKLVASSKDENDYILLSNIYIKLKKYDTALKYLESAYNKNYNENILERMSIVLYVNLQRKKDAIAQLETHSRIHGCSKTVCMRLIGFYSDENNINGLLSTYLRLYSIDKNDQIAQRIMQIYGYKKEYIKLINFLEENKGVDDKLLLELYLSLKDYKKAYLLADKLYKQTGDVDYLGQSAIFEYESTKDKNNKTTPIKIINKLEKVIKTQENPLYLNYLGYLLIDHNINIKKGIDYVKRALKLEPNSAFYLDSLGWGYYKLGAYKKAYKIIKKATKLEGGDNREVLIHLRKAKSKLNPLKNYKYFQRALKK